MSSSWKIKARNVLENKEYPAPLASHEDVVKDPIVFWDTPRRFHFIMGPKFMIPVIGGKVLDLHFLYVEATNRGGYEKVYLFRMQGPLYTPTITAAFPVSNPSCKSELAIVEYSPKKIREVPDPVIEDPSRFTAIGTIDGKFDCGYLVSVKLGSDVLNEVLYHPEQPGTKNSIPESKCAIVPYTPNRKPRNSGWRRRSRRSGDPSCPKPNRSCYNFFFAEKHYKLKSLSPNREREFTKMICESWSNLSPGERLVYQNLAGLKDKERYKRELKVYKERLKLRQAMEVNEGDQHQRESGSWTRKMNMDI